MNLLIAPHDDDAELFAAFTCLEKKPLVLVCTDSHVQRLRGFPVSADGRHEESRKGLAELGVTPLYLGVPDDLDPETMGKAMHRAIEALIKPGGALEDVTDVWTPYRCLTGHAHHNTATNVAKSFWDDKIRDYYLTYDRLGKQMSTRRVDPLSGDWIAAKLRALSHHRSQMNMSPGMGCWPHFLGGLEEYYAV